VNRQPSKSLHFGGQILDVFSLVVMCHLLQIRTKRKRNRTNLALKTKKPVRRRARYDVVLIVYCPFPERIREKFYFAFTER